MHLVRSSTVSKKYYLFNTKELYIYSNDLSLFKFRGNSGFTTFFLLVINVFFSLVNRLEKSTDSKLVIMPNYSLQLHN